MPEPDTIAIQRMLAHRPNQAEYNELILKCLKYLLEKGFELHFDKYGMQLHGDYVDGPDIEDQILNVTFKVLDDIGWDIEKHGPCPMCGAGPLGVMSFNKNCKPFKEKNE